MRAGHHARVMNQDEEEKFFADFARGNWRDDVEFAGVAQRGGAGAPVAAAPAAPAVPMIFKAERDSPVASSSKFF